MKNPYLLLSLLALLALLSCPVDASTKPKATPKPNIHTVIESISTDSITVKEPKETKTYKIGQFTEITYNGQPAKTADLKSGMRVEVSSNTDTTVADRIDASEAPKKSTGSKK
ncbi:MAG: hypothetical protein WCD79_13580 [Chthoniobacteraceae bacterium]